MDEQAKASTYKPRPGSVAAAALAYMANVPRGVQVESAVLATAIGAPLVNGLMSTLSAAVKAGLLCAHKVKSGATRVRTNAYSRPKLEVADGVEAVDSPPPQIEVPARKPPRTTGVPSVFALADRMDPDTPPLDLASAAPAAPPPEPAGLNWKPGKPLPLAGAAVQISSTFHVAPGVSRGEVVAAVQAANQRTAESIGAQAPAAVPAPLDCALWSNGELWLRIDGAEPIVLRKAQTETLIHYLDRMAIEPLATTT